MLWSERELKRFTAGYMLFSILILSHSLFRKKKKTFPGFLAIFILSLFLAFYSFSHKSTWQTCRDGCFVFLSALRCWIRQSLRSKLQGDLTNTTSSLQTQLWHFRSSQDRSPSLQHNAFLICICDQRFSFLNVKEKKILETTAHLCTTGIKSFLSMFNLNLSSEAKCKERINLNCGLL